MPISRTRPRIKKKKMIHRTTIQLEPNSKINLEHIPWHPYPINTAKKRGEEREKKKKKKTRKNSPKNSSTIINSILLTLITIGNARRQSTLTNLTSTTSDYRNWTWSRYIFHIQGPVNGKHISCK